MDELTKDALAAQRVQYVAWRDWAAAELDTIKQEQAMVLEKYGKSDVRSASFARAFVMVDVLNELIVRTDQLEAQLSAKQD